VTDPPSADPVADADGDSDDLPPADPDAKRPRSTRRRLLAGLGGFTTLGAVAGCGGRDGDGDGVTDAASPTTVPTDADDRGPAPEPLGPWPQARADAGNTGFVAAGGPTADPSVRWRVPAAGTVGASVGRPTGTASPDSGVYVAGEDGRVAGVTPQGTRRWRTTLAAARFPPAVGDGQVVVPVGDALAVLDADSGDRLRSVDLPADAFGSPTLAGDRALVGTFAGGVVAVDRRSGGVRWQSGAPSRAHPPVVAGGTAYVAARRWDVGDDRPGVVAALDVDSGAVEWERPLDGEPTAPPAVRDGVVYAGTNRGRVHALDAATGDRRWREPVGDWVTRGPTAGADGIYVVRLTTGPAKLASDGTVVWRSDAGGGTNPVLTDDLAVVGTDDGVVAVGRDDGRTRWRAGTDAGVRFGPHVADGRVYAADGYGGVYAFGVDTGEPAWRLPFRPVRMPGPVVGPRTVAGGSRDGGTYDLLATDGTAFPLSGGAATTGVTPAVLDGRDLSEEEAAPTRTADGDLLFGDATRTAGSPDGGRVGGETLLGGGVDGSLFRVRTAAYGPDPSGDLGPTPTPTPTPEPGDPTASPTPVVDYPEAVPAWTTTLDAGLRSPVTSAGGVAYVGTETGVVAVDPRDGSRRWRRPLGGPVPGAPAVADGRAFAVTAGGRLVGLDAETGAVEWELGLDAGSGAGPAVAGGTVYVATDDGVVRTIGVDGEGGWAREVAAPVRGGVAVTDARAVVGTEAAEVAALDRDDGSIAWRAATRGPVRGTPAVAGDTDPTAYAADNDGTLSAFDVGDGSVRFRVRVGRWADAPPAVGFGAVFVADGTGRVAAVVGE
jgi:outer membrane protein assembly factor BamB